MSNEFTVEIHEEGGTLWGQVVEHPGCFGTGDTLDELAESIGEALALTGALHPRFSDEPPASHPHGSTKRSLVLC